MDRCEIGEVLYGKSSDVGITSAPDTNMAGEDENEDVSSSSDEEEEEEAGDIFVARESSPNAMERAIKPLGHGVLADVPLKHEDVKCKLVELDVLRRNWQLVQMRLSSSERLVSLIFETDGIDNVRMPDDVIINIPVLIPRSKVRPEKMYDFFFMVENAGVWSRRPAEYKNRNVKASIKEFKSLCVIARLKPEEHVITPKGFNFVSDKDQHVTVNFPEGTVEKDTNFKFIVETVDPKRSMKYKTYNPSTFNCILGFTTILHVQHVHDTCLKHLVEVCLPIHKSEDEKEEEEVEGEVVFLRWEGDEVEIVQDEPTREESSYSIPVKHFSGYSAVRKDKSASNQDVLTAARILAGKENLCTLLSLIKVRAIGPTVLLDVVESCKVEKVLRIHRRAGMKEIEMSRSRDIPVSDRERIKIELGGNLAPVSCVPRDVYNLTFVKAAATNNVSFPLQTRVSSSTYSIINFRGGRGRWVHSIHFDLGLGTRNPKNTLLCPTSVCFPTFQHYQTELKYRPVSDVPVTRVVFKGLDTPDSQWDDSRPVTRQSTSTMQSVEADSEMNVMFDRPVNRAASMKSESTVASSTASVIEKRHPVLSEKSLLALSEQLSMTEWNRVLVELNIGSSDIARVCEEATRQNFSQAFKLLVFWIQTNRGKSDRDLINILVAAFVELCRIDMAEVIRKAGRTHRHLKRSDFKKM
ncbi:uncharacterized protein [Haliotis cracherodii]|uniref:uncharacterized protein n=1 Tax=Haliotis cracherodii TaxID=6455 RepID=UPI0039EB111E